jgi:hypothetical protein
MTSQLLDTLRQLECELHQSSTRGNAARLQCLLHVDFREVGYSGRSYTLSTIMQLLLGETEPLRIYARDFELQILAENLALLTYRDAHQTEEGELFRHCTRASLWQHNDNGWQMIYHQGTPSAAFEAVSA